MVENDKTNITNRSHERAVNVILFITEAVDYSGFLVSKGNWQTKSIDKR